MSIADQIKIQQLEDEIRLLKMAHTQTSNIIHAAIISIDEGEIDEARDFLRQIVDVDETT